MALAATDNVVDTLQMHVSKHACYELFVNYSGVDGLTREFTKVGLVVGDPVFANNLSGGCDCVLCSKTVGCGFCVWDEEFEIGRKGGVPSYLTSDVMCVANVSCCAVYGFVVSIM